MAAGDGALEGVEVLRIVGHGGIGPGHFEKVAEFREKQLVISALGGFGFLPSGSETQSGTAWMATQLVYRHR